MAEREILVNSRFYLELSLDGSDEAVDARFMDCKGFKTTQDVIEACEVTPGKWANASHGQVVRTKMPGNVKVTNLVLRRGMTSSKTVWKWFEAVQEGSWSKQRRDGSLNIYDQGGALQARFEFRNGWPASYTVADVSVNGSEFEIEEMEVAVESLVRVQ